jgi:predicted AlkP superfamily pyrophosphatase or phosphodiesterase
MIRAFALAVLLSPIVAVVAAAPAQAPPRITHVLLLSIDGFHEVDLANCIADSSCPQLAALARHAETYTDAYSPRPSDSFPGTIAQVTGGTPRTTGVYYDDTFDRSLFPPGSDCRGPAGSEVRLTGHLDRDTARLDGGSASGLEGNAAEAIDPARLPLSRRDGHCRALWPHDYLRVNTLFGVVHASGLRTAWMDKHPAYEILNGPGGPSEAPGRNIDDFFAPEIDAVLTAGNLRQAGASARVMRGMEDAHQTFEDSIAAVRLYDELKVHALLAQIDGRDHTGRHRVGTPAFFGMNFQAVSVGQKRRPGGYTDTRATPDTALRAVIGYVDGAIGRIVTQLRRRGLAASTLVIITAKHGNAQGEGAGCGARCVSPPGPVPRRR